MILLILLAKLITFVVLGTAALAIIPAIVGAIVLAVTDERINYVDSLAIGSIVIVLGSIAGSILYTLAGLV